MNNFLTSFQINNILSLYLILFKRKSYANAKQYVVPTNVNWVSYLMCLISL